MAAPLRPIGEKRQQVVACKPRPLEFKARVAYARLPKGAAMGTAAGILGLALALLGLLPRRRAP
ncbi:hypothetical protein ASC78_21595 [Variovorax sp. Root318D1]|nr:hypothetical protein ASC78_21595 [Variovorax sp. Root318D1]